MKTTVKNAIRNRMNELRTLRDQIRVDIHLAGMGLRQEWEEIERRLPQPGELSQDLKEATTETIEDILQEVRRFRRYLVDGVPGQTVRSLMTPEVMVCGPADSLAEAARKMWQHDIGWLPVVNPQGRVIAVLTDRDACMAAYLGASPLDRIPVSTAMSTTVHSCGPDATPLEAEGIMSRYKVRRLPVLDADGKLLGVVTLGDLARAVGGGGGGQPGADARPTAEGLSRTLADIVQPRSSAAA